ncbi:hypothetical protein, partial [Bradyrhizobium guangdongense]|uniref:hypothetical protein n=1 Tax=Bradyrhizobium guangdongense TaxID=1325090 RepID=UPI00112BE7E4
MQFVARYTYKLIFIGGGLMVDHYPDPPSHIESTSFRPGAVPGAVPGAANEPTIPIVGYGPETQSGKRRIYLDAGRTYYAEIPKPDEAIVETVNLDPAAGRVRLSVRPTTKVDIGQIHRDVEASMLNAFLYGAAPGGIGTQGLVCGAPGGGSFFPPGWPTHGCFST